MSRIIFSVSSIRSEQQTTLLDHCVKAGCNAFDISHLGEVSSSIFKKWLSVAGVRKDIFIIDVISLAQSDDVVRQVDQSLAALGIDCIDICLIFDEITSPLSNVLPKIHLLVNEKKIKSFGVYDWDWGRLELALAYASEKEIPFIAGSTSLFQYMQGSTLSTLHPDLLNYYKKKKLSLMIKSVIPDPIGLCSGHDSGNCLCTLGSPYGGEKNCIIYTQIVTIALQKKLSLNQAVLSYLKNHEIAIIPIIECSSILDFNHLSQIIDQI